MSGIIYKIKDVVTGDKHDTHTDRASGATSQNPRNVPGYDGRNIAGTNADRREDSDFRNDSRTGGYDYTGSDYAGLRSSDADPQYSSGLDSSGNMGDYRAGAAGGYGSNNFGQRNSNDNQLNPRANRDGSYVQYEPIGPTAGTPTAPVLTHPTARINVIPVTRTSTAPEIPALAKQVPNL
ncbi:hypothetical protein RUND412_008916 [Rhizina undulata]